MTTANLFGSLIFSSIGVASFMYGRKRANARLIIIGIILMVYSYFIPDTLAMYLVGSLLTVSLFVFRR